MRLAADFVKASNKAEVLKSAKAAADALSGAEKEAAAYYARLPWCFLSCDVRSGPWRSPKRRGIGSSALNSLSLLRALGS